jgi:DNA-binding transcriptional MerR regulator
MDISTNKDMPTFNMKAVVQETGLKPDTLRAWERRYGLPTPTRTSGGHRLYSQHDIDTLKWLVARQEEGLSISRAVELWQQLEAEGQDPLATVPPPATEQARAAVPAPVSGSRIDKLRTDWIEACMNFDEETAQHILSQAFALFPIETVCFELLQRALHEIGQGWYEGSISVQQEHFASNLALRQLDALLLSAPVPKRSQRLLVACAPGEQHTFSALLLALLLRWRDLDVVYLGANVPVERLEEALQTVKPQLVILVAQTLYTAGTTTEMAAVLHQAQVPLAFGGAVFSQLEETRNRITGHFLGEDLPATLNTVEQLLQTPSPAPEGEKIPVDYQQALAHYRQNRAVIEADMRQSPAAEQLDPTDLENANEDLGNNITGALRLGNMALLDANIDWVGGLLVTHHFRMPTEVVETYVKSYHQAVKTHLDQRGQPLKAWFEALVSKPDFPEALIPDRRHAGR